MARAPEPVRRPVAHAGGGLSAGAGGVPAAGTARGGAKDRAVGPVAGRAAGGHDPGGGAPVDTGQHPRRPADEGRTPPRRRRRPAQSAGVDITNILRTEFLPHIGFDASELTIYNKQMFFFRAMLRLVRVFHKMDRMDDRDSFVNRCVHNTGSLIAIIFRQIWRHTLTSIRNICTRASASGSASTSPIS